MTFLAIGNSAGGISIFFKLNFGFILLKIDYFTNPLLAKMGYGIMALSGCFAG